MFQHKIDTKLTSLHGEVASELFRHLYGANQLQWWVLLKRHEYFIMLCLRLSVPLFRIKTRTDASLSSVRKDRN